MGQASSTPSSPSRSRRRTNSNLPTTRSTPPGHNHSNSHLANGNGVSNQQYMNSSHPSQQSQQELQPQQQPQSSSSSPSRILRSTIERRRRANLFSSFYPLLSRGSSSSNSNSGNASSEANQGNNSSTTEGTETSSMTSRHALSPMPNSNPNTAQTTTLGGNVSSIPSSNRGNVTRPERPPSRSGVAPVGSSGLVSRSSTRSPSLQASIPAPSGRTPRGLSRVQRMYDEQSIRSTRSSSRASSFIAASPLLNTSTNGASFQSSAVEYMDVDSESIDAIPHRHHHLSAAQHHISSPVQAQPGSALNEHQHQRLASVPSDHVMSHQVEQPAVTGRSRTGASQDIVSSASSTVTGSDSNSLYAGLSNPRGGTSISSSLLPIRPDSDDDDDMANDMNTSLTQTQGETVLRSRSRRYPDPEVVAELIHHQFIQSLREGADNPTSSTSSIPPEINPDIDTANSNIPHGNEERESMEPTNYSGSSQANPQSETTSDHTSDHTSTTPHRMRLRSSSMRGLLGFQATEESATDERIATQDPSSNSPPDSSAEAQSEDVRPADSTDTMDRSQFLLSQLPLFMRLLADFNRLQNSNEHSAEHEERENETDESPFSTESGSTEPDTTSTSGTDGSSNPTSDASNPDASTRSRRRHTTIRFIQIGGGFGPGRRARHGPATAGQEVEGNEGNDGQTGQTGHTGEDFGEAVIMLLTGPTDSSSDSDSNDSSTPEGSDDAESMGTRPRNRSPWVVMTLSGAYLSSLMAAGADGEGGSNYDDLWMLSNLIGPARPTTTTQEAIDNAGFVVGRFEHSAQGMRNIATLGDGTKCLVCMSDYEEGENMRALKCKHGFHLECIDKWLTTGSNKCPVCRAAAVATESPAMEAQAHINPGVVEE
ncbi:hypothetical protein BGX27_005963 [Mortierella sp. AM989]|nr:hypothetical protein BGX27_005963 [Mortierella sp. AM989]